MSVAYTQAVRIKKVANAPPAWIPPPGHFGSLAGAKNSARDVIPKLYSGSPSKARTDLLWTMFDSASGRVFNPDYGNLGCICIHGGGPPGSKGVNPQGVALFALDDFTWYWTCLPPGPHTEDTNPPHPSGFNQYGEYSDGSVFTPYTYDAVSYVPRAWGGGTQGGLLRLSMGPTGKLSHAYDLSYKKAVLGSGIRRAPAEFSNMGDSSGTCAIDLTRQGWWYAAAHSQGFAFVDKSLKIAYYRPPGDWSGGNSCLLRLYQRGPTDMLLAFVGDRLYGWRCATSEPVRQLTVLGIPSSSNPNYNGLRWSSILNCWYGCDWDMNSKGRRFELKPGSCVVSKLIPPPLGQEFTSPWQWWQETLLGYNTSSRQSDGAQTVQQTRSMLGDFNALVEIPAWRCMIRAVRPDMPPQVFRLQGM